MNKCLEKKHQQQSSCLAPHASCSSQETLCSLYEVDHSKLPPNVPDQLKSIRVVMVNNQSVFKVSVRFPSLDSLETRLNQERDDLFNKQLPAFDQSYSMAPQLASEVLYRRVPPHEIAEQSREWSFWTRESPPPCCLSELNGMLKWGKRKLLRCATVRESLSIDEEEKPDKEETEMDEAPYDFRKRKQMQKKPKIAKRQKQRNEIVVHEGFIDRWTAKRYKAAKESILEVMKAKGACAQNPIMRAPLRFEVRKSIGDTGLIDHLLKHMAGKLAPGGADRFIRRHNADGALEYWLESADLMRIGEKAGVADPYWTPLPGWKIGDNPNQDPICVSMFKEIREELAKMNRERDCQQQEDLVVVTTSKSSLTNLDQGEANSSLISGKEKYTLVTRLAAKKSRIEEQLLQIFESYSGVKEELKSLLEELRVLKPTMEESAVVYSETAEPPMLISDIEGGIKDKMGSRDKASKEDKAEKLERLRSSLRICRPQGTFMGPGMSMSPKSVVQQTDSFLVPTPPSVSSTNKSATRLVVHTPNGHNPGSPLKPSAERHAVNMSTSSSLTEPPEKINLHGQVDCISIGKTLDIDLNEFPDAYNTDSTTIPMARTHQRQHKNNMEYDTDDPGKDIMGL